MTYSGDLSGFTGTFNVRGGTSATAGTNVIDCTSTFGGTFYVDNGNLQIGNADTRGSFGNNDIINNGTIIYNRTDSQTYSANFSGTGALKVNSGTLLLNGVNTHAGTTTVAATPPSPAAAALADQSRCSRAARWAPGRLLLAR